MTHLRSDATTTQEVYDAVVGKVIPLSAFSAGVVWFDDGVAFDPVIPFGNLDNASKCRCDFIFSGVDARISYTLDGVNFGFLDKGNVLPKGSLYTINFGAESGSLFNIKADQNVTVDRCIVCIEGKHD